MARKKYHVMGSTHIDLAWKKDEKEIEEITEVFVVRLLDILKKKPAFTYVLEQAYLFRALKKRRPDLIRQLREYVKQGRVEFSGGFASSIETMICQHFFGHILTEQFT